MNLTTAQKASTLLDTHQRLERLLYIIKSANISKISFRVRGDEFDSSIFDEDIKIVLPFIQQGIKKRLENVRKELEEL